jgi:hypothetical protein
VPDEAGTALAYFRSSACGDTNTADVTIRGTIAPGVEEARDVEFTLLCPNDGRIDLGLEDISAVVFRGPESVEVVFECPHCGSTLRAALHVPNLMLAAMELARHAEELGDDARDAVASVESHGVDGRSAADRETEAREANERMLRERAGEPYCEYFRRQLAGIESVEDLLAEIEKPGG